MVSQNGNGKNGRSRHSRRRWIWLGVLAVLCTGAFLGVKAALRPSRAIDASKLATVSRGDIARSVVATGKIEPRAKVEVK